MRYGRPFKLPYPDDFRACYAGHASITQRELSCSVCLDSGKSRCRGVVLISLLPGNCPASTF